MNNFRLFFQKGFLIFFLLRIPVAAFSQIISAGHYHSLAVCTDKTVSAWGRNEYGQLGDGSAVSHTTPVPVSGLNGVTAVASGRQHSIVLKNNGALWAWGDNTFGQLGNGTLSDTAVPVQINISGVIAIAAGTYHSLALRNDGTVWAWGWNGWGQLGNGGYKDQTAPFPRKRPYGHYCN